MISYFLKSINVNIDKAFENILIVNYFLKSLKIAVYTTCLIFNKILFDISNCTYYISM